MVVQQQRRCPAPRELPGQPRPERAGDDRRPTAGVRRSSTTVPCGRRSASMSSALSPWSESRMTSANWKSCSPMNSGPASRTNSGLARTGRRGPLPVSRRTAVASSARTSRRCRKPRARRGRRQASHDGRLGALPTRPRRGTAPAPGGLPRALRVSWLICASQLAPESRMDPAGAPASGFCAAHRSEALTGVIRREASTAGSAPARRHRTTGTRSEQSDPSHDHARYLSSALPNPLRMLYRAPPTFSLNRGEPAAQRPVQP
ncbi:hypothetical protein SAMN04488564_1152 [Lentzea waywayandensis]|uniref:Uncharacterized protein n=1 Tax=Lentzea waywayandensis TaxID=84724 RepID=A0A1I6FFK8_9PSEU|nr:hypothetical protein SAMN04488564_1152 [Lentzea waywayandensis]